MVEEDFVNEKKSAVREFEEQKVYLRDQVWILQVLECLDLKTKIRSFSIFFSDPNILSKVQFVTLKTAELILVFSFELL